jgi:hypothetical protein
MKGFPNFKGFKTPYVDSGQKGSKEEVVGNEVLYIACEEVDWIVKDWPVQWKVPVTQKKGTKPKDQAEAGTSKKTSSPTDNTRKVAERMVKPQEVVQQERSQERKILCRGKK